MPINSVTSAIEELSILKTECLGLLLELKRFCPPENERYPETFRLIATPMLYSAWERCFTLCHAVVLRLVRDTHARVEELNSSQRAVWLLRAPFYQSFASRVRNLGSSELTKNKQKSRGQFVILSEFLSEFEKWTGAPLDGDINTDDLVMTPSNVNREVVEINARAIGISDYEPFKQLKFDLLEELVGRRNELGHGGTLKAPPNPDFCRLWDFTDKLIGDYCDTFVSYVAITFERNSVG